jgi:hypothetical protein
LFLAANKAFVDTQLARVVDVIVNALELESRKGASPFVSKLDTANIVAFLSDRICYCRLPFLQGWGDGFYSQFIMRKYLFFL